MKFNMIQKDRKHIIKLMALLNIGVAITGTVIAYVLDSKGPFPVMVISIALITFVSLLLFNQPEDENKKVDESSMRIAITGTVIIVYLTLVILFSYFQYSPGQGELPLVTQSLLTSFTSIVGIVIAFYFGASAYIQANEKRIGNDKK